VNTAQGYCHQSLQARTQCLTDFRPKSQMSAFVFGLVSGHGRLCQIVSNPDLPHPRTVVRGALAVQRDHWSGAEPLIEGKLFYPFKL
jgi:hypothetical protein